jgi:gas vesicle protein
MNKSVLFLEGMLIGLVAGATVTLLVTPFSGDDLRARIQGEVMRIQNEVQQAAAERRSELEQQLAALRAPQRVE